jgi:hypothetical protein
MIVKAISNQDFALIQSICFDQWHIQKCHGQLRAIEIISHAPDPELFQKFVSELVSDFDNAQLPLIDKISRNTFISL